MVYRRFRINCVLRVISLAMTLALFFFLLFKTTLHAALFILGVAILYQSYALIHYIEKTNRDLTRFFQSIKYSDFSQSFKDNSQGKSFANLRTAFNEVLDAFRKARSEKEEHYRYMQTIVQHVGIGLIAFLPDGNVELINTAAKRLLGVAQLKNIKSLESWSSPLVKALFKLKPKEKAQIRVDDNNELLQLALYSTEFKLRDHTYKLVSIQNIYTELEEKEIDAWQKLIRVLTHEIMNSITPISSLASTINELIKDSTHLKSAQKTEESETLTDICDAAQTIQKRSEGLLHFVDAYRSLTLIQKPNFQIFPIKELFNRAAKLIQINLKEKNIKLEIRIEPISLELAADPELIEQALINLLLNALHAVGGRENAAIILLARLDERSRTIIQVKDNGIGISKDNIDKVFIPFYSTKEVGSGVGLSLSRQIMRLHNGTISVQSKPGVETTVTLRF
ncbi:MAG: ATP-binding protein [Candidatus Aminicenantes bacterium]|nr:ATP-binding protein [Candidatus Aminicenantes bacterium]